MALDRTHDVSHVPYHVKDIKALADIFNDAVRAAFPNRKLSRYREVSCLLLSWKDDDLGVIEEVTELQDVLGNDYAFYVETWEIPTAKAHNSLATKLLDFINAHEGKDNLLIVYYGGHGRMDDDRQSVWSCNQRPFTAEVQWHGLQTLLQQAASDCLILLDCCAASSAAISSSVGITEIIAACGYETLAPGVGEHSFSRSLIDELRYLKGITPFSASYLHNKVFARIKHYAPRYNSSGNRKEARRSPIHFLMCNEPRARSIELQPRRESVATSSTSLPGGSAFSSLATSADSTLTSDSDPGSGLSSLASVWPNDSSQYPRVILTVALEEEEQLLSPDQWVDWVRSIPALVHCTKIEALYKSESTLLMLSTPIAVWNLIPPNPAIGFIGFIGSPNLVDNNASEIDHPVRTQWLQMRSKLEAKDNQLKDMTHKLSTSRDETGRAWEEIAMQEDQERKPPAAVYSNESAPVGDLNLEARGDLSKYKKYDQSDASSQSLLTRLQAASWRKSFPMTDAGGQDVEALLRKARYLQNLVNPGEEDMFPGSILDDLSWVAQKEIQHQIQEVSQAVEYATMYRSQIVSTDIVGQYFATQTATWFLGGTISAFQETVEVHLLFDEKVDLDKALHDPTTMATGSQGALALKQSLSPAAEISESLEISIDSLQFPTNLPSSSRFQYGYKDMQPIILEFHGYDDRSAVGKDTTYRKQLERMVKQLSIPKRESFRVLPCQGYINQTQNRRIGVVFDMPQGLKLQDPSGLQLPRSLQDLYSGRQPVSLDMRLRLAFTLAQALSDFHRVGWVHKKITSANILFFPQSPSDPSKIGGEGLGEPWLFDFECSRPEEAETYMTPDYTLDIYRHPERWDKPFVKFEKAHDVYGLGVILLEIARWKHISAETSFVKENNTFHDGFKTRQNLTEYARTSLPFLVGSSYSDAVLACLNFREISKDLKDLEAYQLFNSKILENLARPNT